MTLEEVGAILKAERERKGLRIEDVANKLKISPRLLTALEAGNDAALPHQAYVRGFIRSYASMLGISQEEVQSCMAGLGTQTPDKPQKQEPVFSKSAPEPPRPQSTHAVPMQPAAASQDTGQPAQISPDVRGSGAPAHAPFFHPAPPKPASDAEPARTEKSPHTPFFHPAPPKAGTEFQPAQTAVPPVQDTPAPQPSVSPRKPAEADKLEIGAPGKKRSIFLPLLLFLLCAAAAGCWWAWQNGKLDFLNPAPAPTAGLDQQLPQADAYMAARDQAAQEQDSNARANSAEGRHSPAIQAAEKPAEAAAPQSQADLALPPVQIPARPPVQERQQDEPAAAHKAPESHKLIITAVEECWVHSNADKTDTRQFSLKKGDTFALTFNKTLELKLGNAGGVRLRYDGEDLPPPGTSGQVRTINFPPAVDGSR